MSGNVADVIAERLYLEGCRHAFGIPGGEVLTLIEALERAGIRFILTKHENAAGFMAEGAYRATGAPGIMVATVGPGIANGVNGVANASQEHVPLIVLTGCFETGQALTYTHQVFDHRAVLSPLCKAVFEATADNADVMIDKAIAIATDARPGPVHIDLPIAVAASPAQRSASIIRCVHRSTAPAAGPDVDAARALFAAARRPLLMVGADMLDQPDASPAIRAFSERFGIPVLTSYKAKGVIDEAGPLSLGGHGLSPKSDAIVLPMVAEADLIICAGYDPIEMRDGWRSPWRAERAIEFAATPNTHYMHQAAHSWICTIAVGLAMLEGARGKVADDWTRPARARLGDAFAADVGGAWNPASVVAAIRAATPRDAVLTLDSGAHRILASQMWTCHEPATLLQSTALCTMGCGLPLAAGYKAAGGKRPVIAIMGDAGLDMTLGELTTLRDLGLPVVVVAFVDSSLSLIEAKQRASGMPNAGVDFGRTDYAGIAQALGFPGVTVSDVPSLTTAVEAAFDAAGPTLIAVTLPRRAYDGLL